MKKFFLSIAAVVALAFGANAQTDQGNMLLGGSLGFESSSPQAGDASQSSFNIIPHFGYFVSDNLAIGLGVGYASSTDKVDDDNKDVSSAFVVRPFGRYYVGMGDQFKFFAELGVGLGFGSNKETDAGVEGEATNARELSVNLSPGFAFFPSENVSIELGFQGLYYNSFDPNTDADDDGTSTIGLGFDSNTNFFTGFFAPQVGVNFYF